MSVLVPSMSTLPMSTPSVVFFERTVKPKSKPKPKQNTQPQQQAIKSQKETHVNQTPILKPVVLSVSNSASPLLSSSLSNASSPSNASSIQTNTFSLSSSSTAVTSATVVAALPVHVTAVAAHVIADGSDIELCKKLQVRLGSLGIGANLVKCDVKDITEQVHDEVEVIEGKRYFSLTLNGRLSFLQGSLFNMTVEQFLTAHPQILRQYVKRNVLFTTNQINDRKRKEMDIDLSIPSMNRAATCGATIIGQTAMQNTKTTVEECHDAAPILAIKIQHLAKLLQNSRHAVVFCNEMTSATSQSGVKSSLSLLPEDVIAASVLAAWVQDESIKYIITENTDGELRRAGIKADRIAELNGNKFRENCSVCHHEYIRDYEVKRPQTTFFEKHDDQKESHSVNHLTGRHCESCGGALVDSLVEPNEALPRAAYQRASVRVQQCDLLVCIGSNLSKRTAELLMQANQTTTIVVIHVAQTPKDEIALRSGGIVIRARADIAIKKLQEEISKVNNKTQIKVRRNSAGSTPSMVAAAAAATAAATGSISDVQSNDLSQPTMARAQSGQPTISSSTTSNTSVMSSFNLSRSKVLAPRSANNASFELELKTAAMPRTSILIDGLPKFKKSTSNSNMNTASSSNSSLTSSSSQPSSSLTSTSVSDSSMSTSTSTLAALTAIATLAHQSMDAPVRAQSEDTWKRHCNRVESDLPSILSIPSLQTTSTKSEKQSDQAETITEETKTNDVTTMTMNLKINPTWIAECTSRSTSIAFSNATSNGNVSSPALNALNYHPLEHLLPSRVTSYNCPSLFSPAPPMTPNINNVCGTVSSNTTTAPSDNLLLPSLPLLNMQTYHRPLSPAIEAPVSPSQIQYQYHQSNADVEQSIERPFATQRETSNLQPPCFIFASSPVNYHHSAEESDIPMA